MLDPVVAPPMHLSLHSKGIYHPIELALLLSVEKTIIKSNFLGNIYHQDRVLNGPKDIQKF
jgi:hypothetical protein